MYCLHVVCDFLLHYYLAAIFYSIVLDMCRIDNPEFLHTSHCCHTMLLMSVICMQCPNYRLIFISHSLPKYPWAHSQDHIYILLV